ncbi:MAG: SAM-dependent MidA family methyltransferase [Cocleimonas sp.]|jgi:SAM-dependent MidA family methyltransferase
MNHSQSLPEPSADTLSHSQKLVNIIRQEIENTEGKAISFRRYMEMALYQPKLGYYVAGTHKIGKHGDFTTAPEISSLFSRCIANQCAEVLSKISLSSGNLNIACVLELGAGSGKMASDILLELEQKKQLPERYYILDVSPDLIHRQQETLRERASHLFEKVEWINTLPNNFNGVILGNEVLDAMPVDVFTQNGNDIYEHHVICTDVTMDENTKKNDSGNINLDTSQKYNLLEQLRPANKKLKQRVIDLDIQADAPYTSELNPNLDGWLKTLSESLQQGLVLLIDYGYTRSEYYLAERNKGTLICHYQHLVNEAPLKYPGLQDITANVDFTAVAESADKAGFNVTGFTSQGHFLANSGLEKYFMQALNDDQTHQYHLAQQIRTLSLPAEMGERFKCIALTKDNNEKDKSTTNIDKALIGFKQFDQRFRL